MKRLDIRLSDEDKAVLDEYCRQKEMTQSDAVRTWIRGLKRKLKKAVSQTKRDKRPW